MLLRIGKREHWESLSPQYRLHQRKYLSWNISLGGKCLLLTSSNLERLQMILKPLLRVALVSSVVTLIFMLILSRPQKILNISIRSPRSLHLDKLNKFSTFSRFLQDLFRNLGILLAIFLCILSSLLTFFYIVR